MITLGKLDSTFVITDPRQNAVALDVGDNFWSDLDEKYGDFAGHSLISCFSFNEPWPTWEVHPAGDEFVCLLEGDVEMTLAMPDGDQTVRLSEPGSFVIVPRGVWHTAAPLESTRMLFVTPGQGTENREQPVRSRN